MCKCGSVANNVGWPQKNIGRLVKNAGLAKNYQFLVRKISPTADVPSLMYWWKAA